MELDEFITYQLEEIEKLRIDSERSNQPDTLIEEIPRVDYVVKFGIIENSYPGKYNTDISGLTDEEVQTKYSQIVADLRKYRFTYDDVKRLSDMIVRTDTITLDSFEELLEVIPEPYKDMLESFINNPVNINVGEIDMESYRKLNDLITKAYVMAIHDDKIIPPTIDIIRKQLPAAYLFHLFEKMDCTIL